MRLFVGIDFPEEVKNKIYQLVAKLQKKYPEIKWEKRENLHLTLKFLGNIKLKTKSEKVKTTTKNLKLEEIIGGTERSVKGIKPFEMRIGEIGYFLRNSLIIWLGMIEKSGGLERLVKKLDREMGKLGFKREKRAFHPHVTLGRKRKAVPLGKWRKIAKDITIERYDDIGGFKVEKIILFESRLSREGATYKVVKEVNL